MHILALAASGSSGREPYAIGAAILVFVLGVWGSVRIKRNRDRK